MTKDKIFHPKRTLDCGGKLLDLSTARIMGILNITKDSFYDGGKHNSIEKVVAHVGKMLEEGADIIDIGAYSSRPGAKHLSEAEEWAALAPVLSIVNKEFPQAILSIDSFRSAIVKQAADHGVSMVNDISAGELDDQMFDTVAELGLPYIMMHMQGTPQNMQENPQYHNIGEEVYDYFKQKVELLSKKGVKDVIIDPGFGFGKTLAHNYELLAKMEGLHDLDRPLLVGVSRKSMIYKLLDSSPEEALNGSTVLHSLSLLKGASILRVHDVKEAKECVKLISFAQNYS
jgi:dihydropteroate synthase